MSDPKDPSNKSEHVPSTHRQTLIRREEGRARKEQNEVERRKKISDAARRRVAVKEREEYREMLKIRADREKYEAEKKTLESNTAKMREVTGSLDESKFTEILAKKEEHVRLGRPTKEIIVDVDAKPKISRIQQADAEKAIKQLWRRGVLDWKLDDVQKEMYAMYRDPPSDVLVWSVGRQNGKSYVVSTIIIEECIRNPGTRIALVFPQQNMARKVIKIKFNEILVDCPDEIRPEFKPNENTWVFPNRSEVILSGADGGNIESLRGQKFERIFIDEAGFIDDLDYCLNSVLFPTMTNAHNPLTVMISTPPKTNDHHFIRFIEEAQKTGSYLVKTLFDSTRITDKQKAKIVSRYIGGRDNIQFRREFLCQLIADVTRLVIPESIQDHLMNDMIMDHDRPQFFDSYTSVDFGVKDWTGGVFAYYDFRNDCVVIVDEFVLNSQDHTTATIAENIKQKELENFQLPDGTAKPPAFRVCDNDLQIIMDLNRLHNLVFIPTRKDDKTAAINEFRYKIGQGKLKIHPRCKNLIFQLKNGVWNKAKNRFEHTSDGSHLDVLDAAIYMVRNIQYQKNPFPANHGMPSGIDAYLPYAWRMNGGKNPDGEHSQLKNLFTPKFKKRI